MCLLSRFLPDSLENRGSLVRSTSGGSTGSGFWPARSATRVGSRCWSRSFPPPFADPFAVSSLPFNTFHRLSLTLSAVSSLHFNTFHRLSLTLSLTFSLPFRCLPTRVDPCAGRPAGGRRRPVAVEQVSECIHPSIHPSIHGASIHPSTVHGGSMWTTRPQDGPIHPGLRSLRLSHHEMALTIGASWRIRASQQHAATRSNVATRHRELHAAREQVTAPPSQPLSVSGAARCSSVTSAAGSLA